MTDRTMTTREFYDNVLTLICDVVNKADPSVDIDAMGKKALQLIDAIDARNEKAKARPRKANAEVAARRDAITAFISDNTGEFTADEIAELTDMTPAQASSALRVYVSAGAVKKGQRKLDSKHTKVTYIIGD